MSRLSELFLYPPKQFSPVPIWWWSGDRLDRSRLRWQMERMAEGGVYNLIVLNLAPTGPLYGSEPDDPPFMSEAWWEIFRGVCRDAEEVGVYLWFYDQIGFSGANLQGELVKRQPAFAGEWLERLARVTEEPVTLRCPSGGRPLAGAAVPVDEEGRPVGPAVPLPVVDGTVRWEGHGRHRVMLFYALRRGFDYLSPEAGAALIDTVHGEFERRVGDFFGRVIVGSFQDELPSLPTWGARFPQAFQRRYGYDLMPHLAALWEELGPEAEKIRGDYHRLRAELAEEAFFRPLFQWHERHGLICGFDQQGPARAGHPIEAVRCYADYLRTHRWFAAPGSDHHGEAKIHSSLAHLYGRPRVWIESFHSSGWGGTLEETFDWLLPWLRAGANLYDPHAVYYSTRGGWWEWAPPSTCWRQPYWRHYRLFARTVSRLCAVLSQGQHLCDVAVLYPTATVQAGLRADGAGEAARRAHETYLALVGSMHWLRPEPGILDRDRRDFDVLDDDSVQRAEVVDGCLQVAGERYKVVVLPACRVLESQTAATLRRFVEQGGRLIAIGESPQLAAGRGSDDGPVAALARWFAEGRCQVLATPEELPGALADLPRQVEAPVPTLLRRCGEAYVLFVPGAFPAATRQESSSDWRQARYSFDPARYAREMTVTVRGVQGRPQLWDPGTGQRRDLPAEETADGMRLTIPLDGTPAALVVWEPETRAAGAGASQSGTGPDGQEVPSETVAGALEMASAPRCSTAVREEVLAGPWTCRLEPTLDNRWGDLDKPDYGGAPPVQVWTFRHRREAPGQDGLALGWHQPGTDDGSWEKVRATFGVRGWWRGPAAASDLPSPLSVAEVEGLAGSRGARLVPEGWQPAVYSDSRGIERDPLHLGSLGPKGYVPEEFLHFGRVPAGQAVHFRTAWRSEAAGRVYLAIGAPARKEAWWNGQPLGADQGGYLWLVPVDLHAGLNVLEFRLQPEQDLVLRAYYALVRDPEAFARPEWIELTDEPRRDSLIRLRRHFHLPFVPATARLQLGADAPCVLLVNGREAGRQGGFDPYGSMARIQPYDIVELLRPGENEIVIEMVDTGRPVAALCDALVEGAGGERLALLSGPDWLGSRDGVPVPVRLRRRQWHDPGWSHLFRRPHPLPAATWLAGPAAVAGDGAVLPHTPDPLPGVTAVEWFRFVLPPGAVSMNLPVAGVARVFVDGQEVPVLEGRALLPGPERARRVCAVRVEPAPGRSGGAVWDGPPTFAVGQGTIEAGDWSEQGLAAYAGGVVYTRPVALERLAPGRRLFLDLGTVRGTAEVWVNGGPAGVRIWSPYRFDLTPLVRPGLNQLEVRVYNTLAPYLAAVSPTHYIFPGQTVSGVLGPVRLGWA